MDCDVVVVGAGMAGCSAAIHLARRGARVWLFERAAEPRDKLCGEFLSPETHGLFQRLGVDGAVRSSGATSIRSVTVTGATGASLSAALPGEALGLSRIVLDELLVRQAERAGASVRAATAVTGIQGSLGSGFAVHAGGLTVRARTVVAATGRTSPLERKVVRAPRRQMVRRVAFKAHYAGLDLGDRIEVHAFPGGYCGISPIEGQRTNVCWVADERVLRDAGNRPELMLEWMMDVNRALGARLGNATRLSGRFLATSPVPFGRRVLLHDDVLLAGDAAGMIAPICGDGMAMALRAGEMAAGCIGAFLAGEMTAEDLRCAYPACWRREFRVRLAVGRLLHESLRSPFMPALTFPVLARLPALTTFLIRASRDH
jgi:menaquinone-9 beta-reductase